MTDISRVALFGKLSPLAYQAIESATDIQIEQTYRDIQPQLTTATESPQHLKEKPKAEPELKTLSEQMDILAAGLSVPSAKYSG